MRFTVIAIFCLLTACGGDTSSAPVPISPANLDGYWIVSSPEVWGPRPGLMHFGVDPYPGEVPEGTTRVAEVANFAGGGAKVVAYTLTGSTLQLDGADWSGTLTIESLTRDTMVVAYRGDSVVFTRTSDCAGPGFWMDGGVRVATAAWDRFGGLHLVGNERYGWVAPGRCAVTYPVTPITGATIDAADNGDVRLLRFARSGALPGEITVTTVPAKPWARETLDQTRKIVPAPSTPANDAPPLKSKEVGGELVVFYAHGAQLFAASDAGETALVMANGSTFTPGHLTITDLADKSWIIRAGNYREGLRYVDGAYEPWQAELIEDDQGTGVFASVFAYDGETLYAAWTTPVEGSYPAMNIGKKVDGVWQRVSAGAGFPLTMRVDGGVIDVIGSLDEEGLGPRIWTRLPRFAEDGWEQEFALSFDGTFDAVVPRSSGPGGEFGPDGEVFMAITGAVWRRVNVEKAGEHYRWNEVEVTFKSETDGAVVFPTLGERCEVADVKCSFKVPTSAFFPAVVEVPGESAAANLVGGRAMLTRNRYAVQIKTDLVVDYGPTALRLETTVRRMTPAVLGPDEVQSTAGVAVAYPGGFAVTRRAGGVVVSKIEGGEVVDEVELNGFEPKRLHARSDGGFTLPLSPPTLTGQGVGLLSADLELEGEVLFPEGMIGYVLTDDGFVAFTYEGNAVVASEHTVAGSSARSWPLGATSEVVALGDGLLAFDAIDGGVAPTFAGDASKTAWRKVRRDGAIDWTLTADLTASPVWSMSGGDLFLVTQIGPTFEIGGETYSGASPDGSARYFVGRFDGATGVLKSQRVTALAWNNGVPKPTSVTGDADGVLMSESFAADLMVAYVPFAPSAVPVVSEYVADVIGGYCLQPGVQCAANDTTFVALGDGHFGGVWSQIFSTNYDGETVGSAAKKAVAGEYVPVP